MSPDPKVQAAVSEVTKAVMKANGCDDRMAVAFDLASTSTMVTGDDPAIRSALALFLLKLAKKLDCDVNALTTVQ